jgi:acyl carrier protein
MVAGDVPKWDSLTHINLILAVEKGFKIRLTTREVRGMKNVGDMIRLVQQKVG